MDKIHREIVTNVLLNHTYFTKIAFIEGKSKKSLEVLDFESIQQHQSSFTSTQRWNIPKKNVNENFI